MYYKLTKSGLNALSSESFKGLSPALYKALVEINQFEKEEKLASSKNIDMAEVLIEIGLVNSQQSNSSSINLEQDEIYHIKSQFVQQLKKDFNQHENLWDMLINLETVEDRDGLMWFMNRIIDMSPASKRDNYKKLFVQVLETENV